MILTKRNGYVYEDGQRQHRRVWREAHGSIRYGWVVHHINFVKDDNHLENLVALPAWRHDSLHADLRKGMIYTTEMLLRESQELAVAHDRLTKDLEQALERVLQVRYELNRIGVPSDNIDKHLDKRHSKLSKKKRERAKPSMYVENRKPKQTVKDDRATSLVWNRDIMRAGGL